jgi:peptidoglycan-associated lipoprotein
MRCLSILLILSLSSGFACHKAKKNQIKSVATNTPTTPTTSGNTGDSSGEISQAPSSPSDTSNEEKPSPALRSEFDPIYFLFDEAALSMDSMRELDEIGEYLEKHPDMGIIISGHTDERGTEEYNIALSDERARSAKDYLTRLRINPERIVLVPYGEEMPAVADSNEEAWAKNRRDEFKIVQKTALRD